MQKNDGRRRSHAANAYAAAQRRWPRTRGRLLASELALRSWQEHVPAMSYLPLSWLATLLLAPRVAFMGWHQAKLGILLAHPGLLRVGELLRLRFSDIVWSSGDTSLLRLRETKRGTEQPVRFTDKALFGLLAGLLATVKDLNEFVIQIGYAKLRA